MLLVAPIADAFYPRLACHHALGDSQGLARDFHLGAQAVSVIAGSAAATGIAFAPWLLQVWLRNAELAQQVSPLFRVLLFGNLLNALMWIPYRAQLAHGWTGLAARVNIVAVFVLVPLVVVLTQRWGALGAAWAWVLLNVGYVLIGARLMFQKILCGQGGGWYVRDLSLPLGTVFACSLLALHLSPATTGVWEQVVLVSAFGLVIGVAGLLAARELWQSIGVWVWRKKTS
jgi:O-antigen/teichoic acid export membrane protein